MAFVDDDSEANSTTQDPNKQTGADSSALTLGGGGASLFGAGPPGGGASAGAAGGAAAAPVKSNQSGAYTNLSSYLSANSDQAGAMGQNVAGTVANEGNAAKNSLNSDLDAYGKLVDAATTFNDPDLNNDVSGTANTGSDTDSGGPTGSISTIAVPTSNQPRARSNSTGAASVDGGGPAGGESAAVSDGGSDSVAPAPSSTGPANAGALSGTGQSQGPYYAPEMGPASTSSGGTGAVLDSNGGSAGTSPYDTLVGQTGEQAPTAYAPEMGPTSSGAGDVLTGNGAASSATPSFGTATAAPSGLLGDSTGGSGQMQAEGYGGSWVDANGNVDTSGNTSGDTWTENAAPAVDTRSATDIADDPAALAAFQNEANATYTAPTAFAASGNTAGLYNTAQEDVTNAGSEAGQQALLQKQYGGGGTNNYNQGEQNLDQALLGSSAASQTAFKTLADNYGSIGNDIGTASANAQNYSDQGAATTAATSAAAQTAANTGITNLTGTLNTQEQAAASGGASTLARLQQEATSGNISPADAATLKGLTQFGNTYGVNIGDYITANPNANQAASIANTMTPEQYQQIQAYNQLLGGGAAGNTGLQSLITDAAGGTQAGTYTPYVVNSAGAEQAIDNKQTALTSSLQTMINNDTNNANVPKSWTATPSLGQYGYTGNGSGRDPGTTGSFVDTGQTTASNFAGMDNAGMTVIKGGGSLADAYNAAKDANGQVDPAFAYLLSQYGYTPPTVGAQQTGGVSFPGISRAIGTS